MELLGALEWRYASKKMNGAKLPEEKLESILEAIRLAPSSMGLQPYSIIVINSPDMKRQILPIARNQTQVMDCSHLLVFAAWTEISEDRIEDFLKLHYKIRKSSSESLNRLRKALFAIAQNGAQSNFEWAARQTYIALATGIAAAAEAKVDATPMEGFDHEALDRLLHLPEKGLKSLALLPLGYREEEGDWLAKLPKVRREKEKLFVRH